MATNVYYPQKAFINAITSAQNAVITFTANHDFTIGEIVTFRVTSDFGTWQINKQKGKVLATAATTITVDVDTSDWDAFDYSALDTAGTTPPLCLPCCSGVIPNNDIPMTNIDDAFDNRRA